MMKPSRYFPTFLLLLGFCLLGVGDGRAQDEDYTDFGLDELLDMDVVYGASSYEQDARLAPSSVTVITADDIAYFGYTSMGELLSSIPGFYTTSDRSYSYSGVRGFNRPGDYNSRLLVLVDGHRMNDNIYHSGGMGIDFPVQLELIKRIELVRGPSSSLYGSGALFGVINVITRSAKDVDGTELSLQTSSFDGRRGRMSYGHTTEEGLEFLVSAGFLESKGQDIYFPEFDFPETNGGKFEGGDFENAHRYHAKLGWKGFMLQGGMSRSDTGVPTGAWETEFNDNRTWQRDHFAWMELIFAHQTDSRGRFSLKAGLDDYTFDGSYAYDYADYGSDPNADPYIVLNIDRANGKWLTSGFNWTNELDGRHQVVFGAELRHDLDRYQTNFDSGVDFYRYFESNPTTTEAAIFLLDEIRLGRAFHLNLGLRHDSYDRFASTNPRVAFIWAPQKGSAIKVIYGTAFRAPSAYESFYGDNVDWQLWNPDLQPEQMETWELAVEHDLGRRIKGALSFYRYDIDQMITQNLNEDELLIFLNSNRVQSNGVEFSLDARMRAGIRGRLSFSHQRAKDPASGQTLSNSPGQLAKLTLVSPLRSASTTLAAEFQYMSSRLTEVGSKVGSHALVHTNLRHEWRSQGVVLNASVRNLLDQKYEDPASLEHAQAVIPQFGRTIRLSISYLR